MAQPGAAKEADTALVRSHLKVITGTAEPRSFEHVDMLDEVAAYIGSVFTKYSDSITYQEFDVNGKTYRNVIASFGPKDAKRLIVGAHYDVCGPQEGADDNASGVVGLLELARLLADDEPGYRIDLVAYSLEEPPFFRTPQMGSYIHAESLHNTGAEVYGMVCLEMIGYFDDRRKSQNYPLGILRLVYGSRGDFITVVRKFGCGKFARDFKRAFKRNENVKTKGFQAPGGLRGIDFSDHLNYWSFGFSAVMITNTGFYRNPNYHRNSDVISSLDIGRLTKVITQVYKALGELCTVMSKK